MGIVTSSGDLLAISLVPTVILSARTVNTGELISGEMIRHGGPDVMTGVSHTDAAGNAAVTGPDGTANVFAAGAANTRSTWIRNPLLRKGGLIGTGPGTAMDPV